MFCSYKVVSVYVKANFVNFVLPDILFLINKILHQPQTVVRIWKGNYIKGYFFNAMENRENWSSCSYYITIFQKTHCQNGSNWNCLYLEWMCPQRSEYVVGDWVWRSWSVMSWVSPYLLFSVHWVRLKFYICISTTINHSYLK